MPTADRLVALMDHLGLATAHFATQMPADVGGLATAHAARIAGLVLCVPTRLDPGPFSDVASRLLMIAGDSGLTTEATERALERLPSARRELIGGYAAAGWSDVVADRTVEVASAMTTFLTPIPAATPPATPAAGQGAHAGLTYRITGDGPALILLPFFLAPSQWTPAVPELARHFTVIELGGPHIGGVAALEDRARAPTYRAMFHTLVDGLDVTSESRILDVGCGSGALDRLLVARLGSAARIDAVDVNPFFLREAASLAANDGIAQRIRFAAGSATALPFETATFDAAFSITVLEECDADQAIAEMMRVVRPGGRVAIAVRAIDLPQWWNMTLPPAISAKANVPPQSVGQGGVADASLYARMRRAGLIDLVAFPTLVTLDRPDGPIWRYREDHILSQLTPAETTVWQAARTASANAGLLMTANALHCAVARKPI